MNIKKIIFVVSIFIIGIILGIYSMMTPAPKKELSGFSAEVAATHIQKIAREPHDVTNVVALTQVREYIQGELVALNLDTTVHTYGFDTSNYGNIQVNNLLSEIKGESDSYILIVAHYDSVYRSYGAADDGYGVATMLEIARLVTQSDQPLKNGIKLLFTDAEEIGLVGAKLEVKYNPELFKNVGFVINLEARGIKGPAIMFETSNNNLNVIDFYRQASLPVAYSFAGDVYAKMPNGTDFTIFKKFGLNGINFAVLDSLDYYHTPNDNYDNINLSSIQHYGDQVVPLVNEFIYNEKYSDVNYFDGTQNTIYFTFLPNVFITYSVTIGYILMTILILGLIYTIYLFNKKGICSIKTIIKSTCFYFIPMILFLLVGLGITFLISAVSGVKFNLTYMPRIPGSFIILITVLLMEILTAVFISHRIYKSKSQSNSIILGAISFNTILLVAFMILLSGGSYLFFVPALFSLIYLLVTEIYCKDKIVKGLLFALMLMIPIIIYLPVLYLLNLALTIGALGVVTLFAFFPLTMLATNTIKYVRE